MIHDIFSTLHKSIATFLLDDTGIRLQLPPSKYSLEMSSALESAPRRSTALTASILDWLIAWCRLELTSHRL